MNSKNDQKNAQKPEPSGAAELNKTSKYIVAFFAVVVIIFGLFLVTRNDHGADATVSEIETAAADEPEKEKVVIAKKAKISKEKEKVLKEASDEPFLGNKYAPVVMIEYASLSCHHCADFHKDVLEKLIPNYIETGKLKYIYRDFPLNLQALEAAKLAHCAPDDKYFGFLKALFKSQDNWAFTPKYQNMLKSIGKLGGVPEDKFDECLKDKELEEKILKTQKDAAEILQVKSTPTLFINGHDYNGPRSYEKVSAFIDELLKGDKL